MNNSEELKQEIEKIKLRNKKVEADKDWEISSFRKITIALLTYLVIVVFFKAANLPKPFVNAIIPTLGFVFSTLSLPFLKNLWVKYFYKK